MTFSRVREKVLDFSYNNDLKNTVSILLFLYGLNLNKNFKFENL